jgi:unsaturated rhamnogalacturonyl hydrolase
MPPLTRRSCPRPVPGTHILAFRLALTLFAAGLIHSGATAQAAADPLSPGAIAASMKKVNAWQLAHPYCGLLDENAAKNDSWIRATWYTGVMAAYGATKDEEYRDQALLWARGRMWMPGSQSDVGANIITCAQTYLELYFLGGDRSYIAPTIAWLDSKKSNTPTGARVWYLDEGKRSYIDSLYVAAPTLAMLAKATGDPKYLGWMDAFFWDVYGVNFDPGTDLFYRDSQYIGKLDANGRKTLWARGNGWVLASLPRILSYLPDGDPTRGKYEDLLKRMSAALAKRQQSDGLWRPNLDDAAEYPMPETSGTGFFCYGMAWGIRQGLLDRATYLPVVKKAWLGLESCVSPEGKVQWGQLPDGEPNAVKQEDSQEYVAGTFLLAGSEVLRLSKARMLTGRAQVPSGSWAGGPKMADR